jgi:ABC-2 type transport system ATP-binding protein
METTIEVAGLRKRFGSTLALDGMTFTVSPGQVTGFIGPNGAGKSTTMRVILGPARRPPALMLDEPFNGMDPEGIVWMRGFLAALAAEGRAVLVSSHLMGELQDSASHVVIVGRGKVIADTSVADLLASASGDRVMLRTADRTQAAAVLTDAATAVAVTGPDALMISGLPAERVVALLTENSIPFAEVTAHRATLEQAYMELTRDAVEFRAGNPSGLAGRAAS